MRFTCVIFDLDGTIVTSEDQWCKAFSNVLSSIGVNNSKNQNIRGLSIQENWKKIISELNIKTDKSIEDLSLLTNIEFEKLISQITLNDGIVEFMDSLIENGMTLALATSTKWEITDKVLKQFGIGDYFEAITTGEEVSYSKPDPDIYLKTAEKLGLEPKDCLVVEDSVPGIEAAKDAGMKVIAVSGGEMDDDNLQKADYISEGYSEISLKVIDSLSDD